MAGRNRLFSTAPAEKAEKAEKVPIHFSAEKVPGVFLPPAAHFPFPFLRGDRIWA
jgi:hypothetical protein